MTPAPKCGIYPGVPFATYRQWDAVNNSLLWTVKTKSPLHALYERDHPDEPTPALLFGQQLHAMILEPATWDARYAIRPECDGRTKEGKALLEKFRADKGNREEVRPDDHEKMLACATAVRAQQCRELVCGGQAEVCVVWIDGETGLTCKARIDYERTVSVDWADQHFVADVKSTDDASADGFARSIASYGYYQAAAFYVDGWKAASGADSEFTWLAVEKSPPFVAKAWTCDEQTLLAGRNSYRAALRTWAECVQQNKFPAYGETASFITAPEWCLRREGVGPFNMV